MAAATRSRACFGSATVTPGSCARWARWRAAPSPPWRNAASMPSSCAQARTRRRRSPRSATSARATRPPRRGRNRGPAGARERGNDGSGPLLAAPDPEPESVERESREAGKRPLGNGEAEEPPVYLRALSRTQKQLLEQAAKGKIFHHEEQIRAARRDLIYRKMLQPDLARRDTEAAQRQNGRNGAIDRIPDPFRAMQSGNDEYHDHAIVEAALYEAQRAGVLVVEILQVVTEAEQARAGKRRRRIQKP